LDEVIAKNNKLKEENITHMAALLKMQVFSLQVLSLVIRNNYLKEKRLFFQKKKHARQLVMNKLIWRISDIYLIKKLKHSQMRKKQCLREFLHKKYLIYNIILKFISIYSKILSKS